MTLQVTTPGTNATVGLDNDTGRVERRGVTLG